MQPYFYKEQKSHGELHYLRVMYLYNLTLIIESEFEHAILEIVKSFMQKQQSQLTGADGESHISSINLLKMMDSPHEGATYCIQLNSKNNTAIENFCAGNLPTLTAKIEGIHAGKVMYFESIMEYL
jgi:hypothetical protein